MNTLKVPFKAMGPGLTNEQIAAAEVDLGREIPEAYRKLLRHANGGGLGNAVFYMPRSSDRPRAQMYEVLGLMGLGHKLSAHDLVTWNKMFGHRWPADAMEFASDSLGNGFVVFTSGPRRGEVAFRDHESGDLTALTKSMDEFLDHLVGADAPEVLADFPPVVGHAVGISTRKTKGAAKKHAPKKAPKKVAAKRGAPKKGTPKKAAKTEAKRSAAKNAASKKPSKKTTAR